MAEFECDVFISYKREERGRIELLAQKLRAVGLKVWFDTRLKPGDNFDEQIAGHLKASRVGLVCWTPEAVESTWVRSEASMAHNANKLVACYLEATELIPPFNLVQTEDLSDWHGEDDHVGWSRLLMRLAALSSDPTLREWADILHDGEPAQMRKWVLQHPAGPLRSVMRFCISEAGGVALGSAPKQPRKRKKGLRMPWLATASLLLALGATAAAGTFYFERNTAREAASENDAKWKKLTKEAAALQGDVTKLRAELGAFTQHFDDYREIDARRSEIRSKRNRIDSLLADRRTTLVNPRILEGSGWERAAMDRLDSYLALMNAELQRLEQRPIVSIAPPGAGPN